MEIGNVRTLLSKKSYAKNSTATYAFTTSGSNTAILKQQTFGSEEEREEMKDTLEIVKRMWHPSLGKCESYSEDTTASTYRIDSTFEKYSQSLSMLISSKLSCELTEDELLTNITSLIPAFALAQRNVTFIQSLPHRAVTLDHIFLTSAYTMVITGFRPKITSLASERRLAIELPRVYRCPQLQSFIESGSASSGTLGFSIYKSDIFALGICILRLAYASYTIDDKVPMDIDEHLKCLYPYPRLKHVLGLMLKSDVNERPDFLEMEQFLRSEIIVVPEQLEESESTPMLLNTSIRIANGNECMNCRQRVENNAKLCKKCEASRAPGSLLQQMQIYTMKYSCVEFDGAEIHLENEISARKIPLSQLAANDQTEIRANPIVNRVFEVKFKAGGDALSVSIVRDVVNEHCLHCMRLFAIDRHELETSQYIVRFCSDDCRRKQIELESERPVRFFDCRSCGKIITVELKDIGESTCPETLNFCSDSCGAAWTEKFSEAIKTQSGCMFCDRSWAEIQAKNMDEIRMKCDPSHYFCRIQCLRSYIQQEMFTNNKKKTDVQCKICCTVIDLKKIELAEVNTDLTKSMQFSRNTHMCQICKRNNEQMQLNCFHCFCVRCVPEFLDKGANATCPLCSGERGRD